MVHSLEEAKQFVELLRRAEWPLPIEVFFAFCENNIVAGLDLALIRSKSFPEVLLTLRPDDDPYFGGQWHIPGSIIIPGTTAISTIQDQVLKREVGIDLNGSPELLLTRDILKGHAGPDISPRGQEVHRLFHYVLQDDDPVIGVDEIKKFFGSMRFRRDSLNINCRILIDYVRSIMCSEVEKTKKRGAGLYISPF